MRGHRPCQICIHPAKTSIEQAVVAGLVHQKIAEIFGVSRKAVGRHLQLHMSQAMRDELIARKKARKKKKTDDERRRKNAKKIAGKKSPSKWAAESVASMAERAVASIEEDRPAPPKLAKITQLRAHHNLATTHSCDINSIVQETLVLKEVVIDGIAQAQACNNEHAVIVGVREARELLKFCLTLCETAANMPVKVETIDVINSAEWQRLEGIVLSALDDEPDIRNKIAQRIIDEARKGASYSIVKS